MIKTLPPAARKLFGLLLLIQPTLMLHGCSATAPRAIPQTRLEAIHHNRKGVEQEQKGNRAAALKEFDAALRLHSSIENFDGITISLINIARTHRLRGDLPAARSALGQALTLPEPAADLASELYFEQAKMLVASGDLAGAKEWALRSSAAEKGSDTGRRLNLVGTILLRQGEHARAAEYAGLALKANREQRLPAEEANSHRLLGEVHLARGSYAEAAASYHQALLIDKNLGLTKKIATDLRGLGGAASKQEDLAAAIRFYQRALQVSLAGGDTASSAQDMADLAALYRRQGEPQLAAKMEQERAKLVEARPASANSPSP